MEMIHVAIALNAPLSNSFVTQPAEVIPNRTYHVEVAALVKLSGRMDGSLRARIA